jgi:hypothetical protein
MSSAVSTPAQAEVPAEASSSNIAVNVASEQEITHITTATLIVDPPATISTISRVAETAAPSIMEQPSPLKPKITVTNSEKKQGEKNTESDELVRYSFKDVDTMLSDGYIYPETNNSTICDIVAMYLKGQKILYTEAKTVCEVRLHYLMLPAILITAAAAILSMILKDSTNGAMIVSILNSVNTFLLTLINYLKLDARAEAHRTAAYKFDKLQSFMEFNSGRILFDKRAGGRLVEILQKVENDVREIKETNQFILPEKIRYEYPRLYSINVFVEVKKIINQETLHIEKIKTYMNKILELEEPLKQGKVLDNDTKTKIAEYEAWRQSEVNQVLLIKNLYLAIDEKFEIELEKHRKSLGRHIDCCAWLKS